MVALAGFVRKVQLRRTGVILRQILLSLLLHRNALQRPRKERGAAGIQDREVIAGSMGGVENTIHPCNQLLSVLTIE